MIRADTNAEQEVSLLLLQLPQAGCYLTPIFLTMFYFSHCLERKQRLVFRACLLVRGCLMHRSDNELVDRETSEELSLIPAQQAPAQRLRAGVLCFSIPAFHSRHPT